jgi:HSP20 family protein
MATQTKETAAEAKEAPQAETSQAMQALEKSPGGASWPAQAWVEMNRYFENLFTRDFPAVDIIDRENDVLVLAELPGVRKEDLHVSVGETSLTIKGSIDREERQGDYFRREISRQGHFSRTLSLPLEVEAGKGKAKLKECLLELTLPKSAKRHVIKVE